jgi:hypothetical protein
VLSGVEDLIAVRRSRIVLNLRAARYIATVLASAVLAVSGGLMVVDALSLSPTELGTAACLAITFLALALRAAVVRSQDGSDRMLLLAIGGVLSWVTLGSLPGVGASLTRLAILALLGLAYFEAGLVKIRNPHWRNGRQLASIMNLKEFGNKRVALLLLPRARLSLTVSWMVMSLELFAGALLAIGGLPGLLTAAALTLMHLTIAVVMGLGRFFYPFVGILAMLIATQG